MADETPRKGSSERELPSELPGVLEEYAERLRTRIDPSLYDELGNYVRHARVCDLGAAERGVVVQRIGELAIELPGKTADAGGVRSVLFSLCPDGHSTCFRAAQLILNTDPAQLRRELVLGASRRRRLLEQIERWDQDLPESMEF